MFKPSLSVKTITDDSVKVANNLSALGTLAVYVGIPESNAVRKGKQISNAQLAFIHTHGVRTIDARRIMGAMMLNRKIDYHAAEKLYVRSRGSMAFSIPPRPLVEPAIEADKAKIIPELEAAAKDQLDGNRPAAVRDMKRAGLMGQSVVRNWFTDARNKWPPNAPSTIKRKGSSRPLIDTGQLRASISYVLGEETK